MSTGGEGTAFDDVPGAHRQMAEILRPGEAEVGPHGRL